MSEKMVADVRITGSRAFVEDVLKVLEVANGAPLENESAPSSKQRTLTRQGAFWDGLSVGVLGLWAWTSLRQDYLGLDGYIATVRAGWADWRYTVPLAIVALVACAVVGVGTVRRARADDSGER